MIELRRIDHIGLRVADPEEASRRWSMQFGLAVRERLDDRVRLSCDDEPYCLELIAGGRPGFDHVGWELAERVSLAEAGAHLRDFGAGVDAVDGILLSADTDGNGLEILPYRAPASRLVPHARPHAGALPGHPRKLGHVNFLTGSIQDQLQFYTEGLGMRLTDWLGDGGVWLHVNNDHHVMALVDKGHSHLHHFAFDVVDFGQMRMALDHLGRHGRWLGWGPTRHGVGGNIASYVRILEEECFVELYCDMEQLEADHQPREWPDDRFSSNTWGPLPPRSYFRFDRLAIDSERESLEMLGVLLGPDVTREDNQKERA